MKKIGRAFRALNKSVSDPAKNEDSLKQAGIIRAQAEAAVTLKPAKTADLPEDQQAKFVDDYRQDMKNFLADVISLESALKANDNQQAKELVAKMKQDMKHGHKEYKKKKDDM